jgi:hypothetical protein
MAALAEMISVAVNAPAEAPLASADALPQPPPPIAMPCLSVIQSSLWTLHNNLLSLGMGVILDYTLLQLHLCKVTVSSSSLDWLASGANIHRVLIEVNWQDK